MRSLMTCFVLAGFVVLSLDAVQAKAADPQVAHMVFFKLKESTDQNKEKLVAACDKYLSDHEGTVYYSAGVMAQDLDRDVNDRDFDVALHVVFKNKAAHDKYLPHPRHLKFIEENKELWEGVRVFDSYVAVKEPKGTYTATLFGEKWTLKLDDKGEFTVSREANVMVEGTYKVAKDEFVLTDQKGPIACKGEEKTGKYKWKLEGKKLSFTKVEDNCQGRTKVMTTSAWVRKD